MNYQALPKAQKTSLKPIVENIRKALYGTDNKEVMLREGLVINFGKNAEKRHTVKIQIVA